MLHPLVIVVPLWLLIAALALVLVAVVWRWRGVPKRWEVVSAEVNFAQIGKVTIRPNLDDIQIAHRAWVELATRKAGIPFDPEYDVVVEIYDSWYELFVELRKLARECPATKVRTDEGTRELVTTLTQVLNLGIRPHLTRWQARFRRWYADAIARASPSDTPQDVQRTYPQYEELVADLASVQQGLRRYMALLQALAVGK